MSALRPLTVCAALLLAAAGCTESSNRYTTHERQVEARTEGDVDLHYAWIEPGALLVAAPLHAAGSRSDFSRARLDSLTGGGTGRSWVSLSLWRFEGDEPLPLGRDGVLLAADVPAAGGGGSIESLPPSKVLAGVADPGVRALLAALLGEGELPPLVRGRAVQLLVALPSERPLHELGAMRATLPAGPKGPGRVVTLAPAKAPATQWDEFRSQPSRARFEALIGAPATGVQAARESAGGEVRESGK